MTVTKTQIEFEVLELEKCPYCGCAPVVWIRPKYFENPYWIGCPNTEWINDCHYRCGKTLFEAVDAWNEDCRKAKADLGSLFDKSEEDENTRPNS